MRFAELSECLKEREEAFEDIGITYSVWGVINGIRGRAGVTLHSLQAFGGDEEGEGVGGVEEDEDFGEGAVEVDQIRLQLVLWRQS